MLRPLRIASIAAALLAAPAAPVLADPGLPAGEVILTVTGSGVSSGPADGSREAGAAAPRRFDRAMLEAIGSTFLQTTTPWTDGRPLFRGVLARDLIAALGGHGTEVRAVALNDYRYDIPVSDFYRYPVLLAYEMDGEPLPLRDKGPLWLIYPLDQYGELRTRQTRRKMVWQLIELQLQ